MKTKVKKWGNSLAVRLPYKTAQSVGLQEGSEVSIAKSDAHILIQKISGNQKTRKRTEWHDFLIPSKRKTKENVSQNIDRVLYD